MSREAASPALLTASSACSILPGALGKLFPRAGSPRAYSRLTVSDPIGLLEILRLTVPILPGDRISVQLQGGSLLYSVQLPKQLSLRDKVFLCFDLRPVVRRVGAQQLNPRFGRRRFQVPL